VATQVIVAPTRQQISDDYGSYLPTCLLLHNFLQKFFDQLETVRLGARDCRSILPAFAPAFALPQAFVFIAVTMAHAPESVNELRRK